LLKNFKLKTLYFPQRIRTRPAYIPYTLYVHLCDRLPLQSHINIDSIFEDNLFKWLYLNEAINTR